MDSCRSETGTEYDISRFTFRHSTYPQRTVTTVRTTANGGIRRYRGGDVRLRQRDLFLRLARPRQDIFRASKSCGKRDQDLAWDASRAAHCHDRKVDRHLGDRAGQGWSRWESYGLALDRRREDLVRG